jgi:tRNA threonylcarbamoyladenosine biosynthesis protein TsaB
MRVLAIDTADPDAAVALLDGERLLAERRWHVATTCSRELLPAIEALLAAAGLPRTAIEAVAVDTGPGGYTSLRTGVATAQGLALALEVPLASVSRLEAQALPHLAAARAGGRPVVAVHDLGRAGVAWATYEASAAGPPATLVAPRVDAPAACAAAAPADALWCGDLTPELHAARAVTGRAGAAVPAERNFRDPADLVRLALLHAAFGDPAAVDVTYLRPPPIGARAPAPAR